MLDLVTEHFIVADRRAIRSMLCDASRWASWLPDLVLTPNEDRGLDGVRWRVTGAHAGSAEVWIEAYGDGAVAHAFLRLEGDPKRLRRRYGVPLQRGLFAAKDALEAGRSPGERRQIVSDPSNRTGSDTWLSTLRPAFASRPTRRA